MADKLLLVSSFVTLTWLRRCRSGSPPWSSAATSSSWSARSSSTWPAAASIRADAGRQDRDLLSDPHRATGLATRFVAGRPALTAVMWLAAAFTIVSGPAIHRAGHALF